MWTRLAIAAGSALAAAGAGTIRRGAARRRADTRRLRGALEAAREPSSPEGFDPGAIRDLPAPVQRYFRAVLQPGQRPVPAVSLAQTGRFNLAESGDQWKSFDATQRIVTHRPGFLWQARIRFMPGIAVFVHDAYIAGQGSLRAALLGLIPLVRLGGAPELAQAELMRFLAEAVWYPTALLPAQGVQWEPVDARHAKATLRDGQTQASVVFGFGNDGLIATVRADARARNVGGLWVPTPWEGHWQDYVLRDGIRVPLRGEVAWILPTGYRPYWRGRVTRIDLEPAP
jgi:hypothetical protein